MSDITLIVINKRKMQITQTHWRTAKILLEHGFEGTFWNGDLLNPEIDAGYILLDFDKRIIVNAQEAFYPKVNSGWAIIAP